MKIDGRGAVAVMLGATGIGLAPILVRLSETGPVATAFYRLALAQPLLWIWFLRQEKVGAENPRRDLWVAALAGLFFAGDMALWNCSLKMTSVANSTLLTNFTPFFVTIAAAFLFHEKITRRLVIGLVISMAGGFLLVGESFQLDRKTLTGDFLAVIAAVFYAGYLLAVKELRKSRGAVYVMTISGVFSSVALGSISAGLGESMAPVSMNGWLTLIALAVISHIMGQGLIAYGLAHVPASISSVMLMWQPVVAMALAWVILDEPLTLERAIGGGIILVGIGVATYQR